MSRKPSYTSFITLTAFLLGILFIYTASSKLMHLGIFELRLERMPQLSPIAHWIAWLIPFTELVIAGLLLIPNKIFLVNITLWDLSLIHFLYFKGLNMVNLIM